MNNIHVNTQCTYQPKSEEQHKNKKQNAGNIEISNEDQCNKLITWQFIMEKIATVSKSFTFSS